MTYRAKLTKSVVEQVKFDSTDIQTGNALEGYSVPLEHPAGKVYGFKTAALRNAFIRYYVSSATSGKLRHMAA